MFNIKNDFGWFSSEISMSQSLRFFLWSVSPVIFSFIPVDKTYFISTDVPLRLECLLFWMILNCSRRILCTIITNPQTTRLSIWHCSSAHYWLSFWLSSTSSSAVFQSIVTTGRIAIQVSQDWVFSLSLILTSFF